MFVVCKRTHILPVLIVVAHIVHRLFHHEDAQTADCALLDAEICIRLLLLERIIGHALISKRDLRICGRIAEMTGNVAGACACG